VLSAPVAPLTSDQPERKEQIEMLQATAQRRQVAGEVAQPLTARGDQQRMMAANRTMALQRRVAGTA
jgi:CHASE3 domain sensor protein